MAWRLPSCGVGGQTFHFAKFHLPVSFWLSSDAGGSRSDSYELTPDDIRDLRKQLARLCRGHEVLRMVSVLDPEEQCYNAKY